MTPPAKQRSPQPSPSDHESSVRERVTEPPLATIPPVSSGAARDRLESKLRLARTVLANLPASDNRARLLHVAVMRRDEALIDGVLAALGASPATPHGSR